MKVIYDPEVDILTIVWSNAAVAETDETEAGILMDYDADGNVVGFEILDASKRVDDPMAVQYAFLGKAS